MMSPLKVLSECNHFLIKFHRLKYYLDIIILFHTMYQYLYVIKITYVIRNKLKIKLNTIVTFHSIFFIKNKYQKFYLECEYRTHFINKMSHCLS